jgi:ubiquitin carboxyl-terminal hydrolase 10
MTAEEAGWLEVGPRQRAAVTRASGTITAESPITKIFGGKLRSELRVPGLKHSITLEPYQPLQLDIQSPNVNNVTDALKGLTRPEALHGNFNSPRGPDTTATKQVFIETLPPVLILHLKRFQYDNKGGTQKIWKKIGFPLDLDLPKEVFPPHKRTARFLQAARYRLIGVVYHHGKNASGGHYTVDVRRQDGREWIRLDDTIIRRIRNEDVAEGGSDDDQAALAAALDQHKRDGGTGSGSNIYDQIEMDDAEAGPDGQGWRQVNGNHSTANGRSAKGTTANSTPGTTTPQKHQRNWSAEKQSIRDDKVAYLLFYQRV